MPLCVRDVQSERRQIIRKRGKARGKLISASENGVISDTVYKCKQKILSCAAWAGLSSADTFTIPSRILHSGFWPGDETPHWPGLLSEARSVATSADADASLEVGRVPLKACNSIT